MPRARNIKPSFFKNEILIELPFEARLLFIGLWTLADRAGRLEDRPKRIKMEIFPADNLDIESLLSQLNKAGFIIRYRPAPCEHHTGMVLDKIAYIQIVNFVKHQNPHIKEAASIIPAPCEHHASPSDSFLLIPESPILNPDILIPDSRPPDDYEKEFQQFKISFPLQGRGFGNGKDAKAKFIIAMKKDSFENIMLGVTKYANYIRITGQDNRDAFRWLEKEQWRDDYTVSPRKQQPTTNDNFTAGCELFLSQDAE